MKFSPLAIIAVYIAVLSIQISGSVAHAAETASPTLDWQPFTEEELAENPFCICDGHYVEPQNISARTSTISSKDAPLILDADEASYILGENIVFKGNVIGSQGSMQLLAEELIYNKDTQDIDLKGDVTLREPGTLIQSKAANINRNTRAANIRNSHYLIHKSGAHGTAENVLRDTKQNILLNNASYTLCEPHDASWHIKANQIYLDTQDSEGKARHAKLFIKDVPVFYFPYFEFPLNNKRKSGLLIPSISQSNSGLDISVPYYFNLAPNYDVTLTPRYLAKNGPMLEVESRYLHPKSEFVFGGAYLAKDDDYSPNNDIPEQRWLILAKEKGLLDEERRWSHEFSLQRVSDRDFMRDLGTSGLDVRRDTQLKSYAKLGYQADKWNSDIYLVGYQSLNENLSDSYKRLPQISFNYADAIFNSDISFETFAQLTHFENSNNSLVTGQRLFLSPSLNYSKKTPSFLFEASTGLKHRQYNLNKEFSEDFSENNIWVPNFGFDVRAWLDRYGKDGSMQTLEPRIKYYYANSKQQDNAPIFDTADRTSSYRQLFAEERFTGYDRISDANQLTLGLSSQYFNADNSLNFDVGVAQQFYFDTLNVGSKDFSNLSTEQQAIETERLERTKSEIGAYAILNANQKWQLNSEYLLDSSSFNLRSASVNLNYAKTPEHYQLFNVGYQYRERDLRDDLHQINASIIYPINRRLTAISAVNYNLEDHNFIEDLTGIEYNNCCWRARLMYHREANTTSTSDSTDYDYGIRFEIQLKGLSNFNSGLNQLLSETIKGFDIREQNYQK